MSKLTDELGTEWPNVIALTKRALKVLSTRPPSFEKRGCYLEVYELHSGDRLQTEVIGSLDANQIAKCKLQAERNALILQHRQCRCKCKTSYDACAAKDEYSYGAVSANELIFSVAGLMSQENEMIAALLALTFPSFCAENLIFSTRVCIYRALTGVRYTSCVTLRQKVRDGSKQMTQMT